MYHRQTVNKDHATSRLIRHDETRASDDPGPKDIYLTLEKKLKGSMHLPPLIANLHQGRKRFFIWTWITKVSTPLSRVRDVVIPAKNFFDLTLYIIACK